MRGKYYEELEVGQVIQHRWSRTIMETDNLAFCGMTQNNQPLHVDEEFAKQTPFGQRIVNGILTMGLVVGLSVPGLTTGTYHRKDIDADLSYNQKKAKEGK